MAFFNFKNKFEKKFQEIHQLLLNSFTNVKKDTHYIFQWINYLNQKNAYQEHMINELQNQLNYMPKSREDIKCIIDSYYSYDGVIERINKLNERVNLIVNAHEPILNKIDSLSSKINDIEIKPKPTLKEKLIKRITRNTKEYVKSIILSFIKKYEKISALQLREMIVEEQGLCSKSSFYRLLGEIEKDGEVEFFQEGKEKKYLYKLTKTS